MRLSQNSENSEFQQLELARTLDAWRLVRALEAHKDDLSRQIEA